MLNNCEDKGRKGLHFSQIKGFGQPMICVDRLMELQEKP